MEGHDHEKQQQQQPIPLSPVARLFHSQQFSCYILVRMGCNTTINPQVIKAGVKQNFNLPSFVSKMVKDDRMLFGKKRWVPVSVNIEDHVIVPNLDREMEHADEFVEHYISNITTTPLDLSKPLWEVHILNVKTSNAEAVAVIRIHHSLGDGAPLMSLLLSCTRKTSDPDALPSVPTKRKREEDSSTSNSATMLVLKDTQTPMKGPPGVELTTKRFLHRTVNMDHIKQVKNAMNMTINDVVLGVTQAGLSRYLNNRYAAAAESGKDEGAKQKRNYLPKSIRLRANILVNLRPAVGIQELADMTAKKSKIKWGNKIGYILLPFAIALQEDDPLSYLRRAKWHIDRKKHSLEAICTYYCATLLTNLIGAKGSGAVAQRVLSNSTLSFTNLMGPLEEISFYGHQVSYIACNVYGHPHALHLHFQSYAEKMTICVAVDPDVIPDPEKLLDELEESLKLIHDAVVKP